MTGEVSALEVPSSQARVGAVILAARQAQNLTQRQLGVLSAVDRSTISRIERSFVDPPARVVKALIGALGRQPGRPFGGCQLAAHTRPPDITPALLGFG